MDNSAVPPLESLYLQLRHVFQDHRLLELALTHKSYANEKSGGVSNVSSDNERLEYLGDAVLDLALSELLMSRFTNDSEGALSKKRASLVNEETLATIARELKLDQLIRLGKGEIKTGGLQKPRILASSFEALLGAVFTDGGYGEARKTIESLFASRLEALKLAPVDYHLDFKTRLQEKVQEKMRATPTYHVESETGPDHDKHFEVSVRAEGQVLGNGQGKSKKAAEQEAARKALETMGHI
jgi:ribonuclease-3